MEDLKLKTKSNNLISWGYNHPFLSCFIALVILIPITNGTVKLMNSFTTGLFAGVSVFAIVFILLCDQDNHKFISTVISSLCTGAVIGGLFSIIRIFGGLQLYVMTIIPLIPFTLLFIALYLKYKNTLNDKKLILILFMFIFWVQLCYTLYMSYISRSIDVNAYNFTPNSSYDITHTGYIKYIVDNWTIPNIDIRGNGQFYHPPFHHYICAIVFSIYRFIFPAFKENFEVVKFVTLYGVIVTEISLYRILKLFGVSDKYAFVPLALFAFQPHMITSCANTNNDTLSTMFMFLAIERAIVWYREQKTKNIIYVALCIGFGMMTKLSVGIVAFPIGFLFIFALFKPFNLEKFKKLFVQYVVFAVICFPLALWFQVRNYIAYKVPFTYLFGLDEKSPFTNMSVWQRMFTPPVRFELYQRDWDFDNSVNVFVELIRTFLFSRYDYGDIEVINIIGTVLYILTSITFISTLVLFVYYVIVSIKKKQNAPEMISFVILLTVLTISYVSHCCRFPYVFTMHYRFVAVTIILFAIATGLLLKDFDSSNKKVPVKAITIYASVWMFFTYLLFQVMWIVYIR